MPGPLAAYIEQRKFEKTEKELLAEAYAFAPFLQYCPLSGQEGHRPQNDDLHRSLYIED